MNHRRCAIGVGIVLAVGAVAWWGATRLLPGATLDIDAAQIQARLDARFPQRSCAMMMACVALDAPQVTLTDGSERVGFACDVTVSLGRRQMPGRVAFSGVLRYVQGQGAFYLDDVQVDNFALTGMPPDLVEVVRVRGPAAIQRALDGQPIYTLGDGPEAALARFAVRDVRVVDGRLRVTFLRFGG